MGQPALALTDYSNLFNAVHFYKACKSEGIKPIIGVDLYFCENAADARKQKDRSTTHLVLLAENETGLKNISRIVSKSHTEEFFFYKPRVDFELLEKHSEGIICLSGPSLDGTVSSLLYDKIDTDGSIRTPAARFKAEGLVRRFIKIFGNDHFFLSVQDNGVNVQQMINTGVRSIADKYGLRTVATNNVHYVDSADAEAHRTLLSFNNNVYNLPTYTDFDSEEYYLKSLDEMSESDFGVDELTLTLEIADRCNVDIDLKKRRLPKYKFIPDEQSSDEYLFKLAKDGLFKILTKKVLSAPKRGRDI